MKEDAAKGYWKDRAGERGLKKSNNFNVQRGKRKSLAY